MLRSPAGSELSQESLALISDSASSDAHVLTGRLGTCKAAGLSCEPEFFAFLPGPPRLNRAFFG